MYPQPNDVYMPRSACPFRMSAGERERRGSGMASALGRRRPGRTLEDAQSDLAAVGQRLQQAHPKLYPAERGYQLTATPLRREFTRNFESTLLILVSTAGFVLLIVCASVANLAVARTMRRDRELALRTALGASQGRLLRQLATESLILALVGGACGLLLAFVGMDLSARAVRWAFHATRDRGPNRHGGAALHPGRIVTDRHHRGHPSSRVAATRAAAGGNFGRPPQAGPPQRSAARAHRRPSCGVVRAAHRRGADGAQPAETDRRRPRFQQRPCPDDADRHELHEVPHSRRACRVPRPSAPPAAADSRRGNGRRQRHDPFPRGSRGRPELTPGRRT